MIALSPLARLAAPPVEPVPRCELCSCPIDDVHRHVVEVGARGVLCACPACALLFTAGDARYRTVPDRVRVDRGFSLPPDRLGIPVGVAFCVHDTVRGLVATYPGPAGTVDAELDPDAWGALAAATPLAGELVPDVEALLVYARRGGAPICYLVPITAAYELAARLRASWTGFSGGDAAERELTTFFATLDRRSR